MDSLLNIEITHHVHAWALTSGWYLFSGHLRIGEDADSQGLLRAAYRMLKKEYGLNVATLQVETAFLDEPGAS